MTCRRVVCIQNYDDESEIVLDDSDFAVIAAGRNSDSLPLPVSTRLCNRENT